MRHDADADCEEVDDALFILVGDCCSRRIKELRFNTKMIEPFETRNNGKGTKIVMASIKEFGSVGSVIATQSYPTQKCAPQVPVGRASKPDLD